MNITDFLLARIEEDESRAAYYGLALGTGRVLAECTAKRAIIEAHPPVDYSGMGMTSPDACVVCGIEVGMSDWEYAKGSFPCDTLRALAAIYKDHPDYQQEWALNG